MCEKVGVVVCPLFFFHACLCIFKGINIFLDGFIPTENLRFRETSLVFKVAETAEFVSS